MTMTSREEEDLTILELDLEDVPAYVNALLERNRELEEKNRLLQQDLDLANELIDEYRNKEITIQ